MLRCLATLEEKLTEGDEDGLTELYAPVLDVQRGEKFAGGSARKSIASCGIKLLYSLCCAHHLEAANLESLLENPDARADEAWTQRIGYEAMQAERHHQLFFFLIAIALRKEFPDVPKRPDVEFEIRKGWRVVWHEHSEEQNMVGYKPRRH